MSVEHDDPVPVGVFRSVSRPPLHELIDEQDIDPRWTFDVFSTTSNDRGPYRTMVGNGNWPIATSAAAVQLGNVEAVLDGSLDELIKSYLMQEGEAANPD